MFEEIGLAVDHKRPRICQSVDIELRHRPG
jgi:hypothetical protein